MLDEFEADDSPLLIAGGVRAPRNLKRTDRQDVSLLKNAAFGVAVINANAPIAVAITVTIITSSTCQRAKMATSKMPANVINACAT